MGKCLLNLVIAFLGLGFRLLCSVFEEEQCGNKRTDNLGQHRDGSINQ